MAEARRLNLRLFLEGIEVPVVSATVTSIPDSPLQTSIQIPASDAVLDLVERTTFHLFYFDPQSEDTRAGDEWKLLSMGEIVGISFSKTEMSRAVMLTGLDFSVYWDTTHLFNASGLGKEGRTIASFFGANTQVVKTSSNMFGETTTGYARLAKLINSKPASFPQMKGLLAGIVHLLEAVGGFYRGTEVYKGFNDYTSLGELRIKLMQQVHAASSDNTSALLFRRKALEKWVKDSIGAQGAMETFNNIAKQLMSLVYHSRQSIPAPPYFPGKETKKKKTYYVSRGVSSAAFVAELERFLQEVEKYEREIQALAGMTAQVDMEVSGVVVPGIPHEATGVKERREKIMSRVKKGFSSLAEDATTLAGTAKQKGSSEQASKFVLAAKWLNRASAAATGTSLKQSLKYGYAGQTVILGLRSTYQKKSKTLTEYEYERVGTHVFKPDIFFTAPPACNVLFPDMYNRLEWSRNFIAEPTRLMLRGGPERSGSIFPGGYSSYSVYFAPDTADMRGSAKLSARKFASSIFEHELYSGIVPAQVQIPWAKVYKIAVKGAPGKKFPFIQRLANFEYIKQHYASRQAQVSGRFNPRFIPGFPALIIDRPLTAAGLEVYQMPLEKAASSLSMSGDRITFKNKEELLDNLVGPQYLGYCQQLTHSISQQGGTTSYLFTMFRDHRDAATKLGLAKATTTTRVYSKTITNLILAYDGWSTKEYKLGPHGYEIVSVVRVGTPKKGFTYWVPVEASGGSQPVSAAWVRDTWNPDVVFWQSESEDPVVYRVMEAVSVTTRNDVDEVAVEYAITPPWLAECWHIAKVGDTYREMFGVDAITDAVGVYSDSSLTTAYRYDKTVSGRVERVLPPADIDPPLTKP